MAFKFKLKLNPNIRHIPWWDRPAFVFWAWFFCHLVKEHYWHYFPADLDVYRECFWCGSGEILSKDNPSGDPEG